MLAKRQPFFQCLYPTPCWNSRTGNEKAQRAHVMFPPLFLSLRNCIFVLQQQPQLAAARTTATAQFVSSVTSLHQLTSSSFGNDRLHRIDQCQFSRWNYFTSPYKSHHSMMAGLHRAHAAAANRCNTFSVKALLINNCLTTLFVYYDSQSIPTARHTCFRRWTNVWN